MAHIRPFHAWRYDSAHVADINTMFSPLFDVVSKDQLEALYGIPNNSIHLSVPRSEDEAVTKLADWKAKGIIRQDPLPAIYIYYQQFSVFGDQRSYVRKGFISMIRISEDSGARDSDIILHEDTISHSVAERTRLLEKTQLNTAPTHGLYEDPDFILEQLMDAYMQEPEYEYVDYQGVINQLSIVQNAEDIARFVEIMAARKVYLADGHHRLASSVELRNRALASNPDLPADSFVHYHLMYLTNLCSDDLRILPIHRVLTLSQPTMNPNPILQRLRNYFEITDITFERVPIFETLKSHRRAFGMVIGSTQFFLTLKPEVDPVRDMDLDLPEAVKTLDYSILHYFVFDRVFDMPYREQHSSEAIEYVKDYGLAVRRAVSKPREIAFITRDTSMEQMMAVCKSGALMPQKSTYFYPKVVCGLVFASIDDNENSSPFDLSFRLSETSTSSS